MSINGISIGHGAGHAHKSASAASGQGAASGAADNIANTGSVSAGSIDAFFKSFSADLQSMLSQGGKTATSGTTTQTAANQPMAGAHQRHHRSEGGNGPVQGASSQMMTQIGQGLGAGSSTAGGIGHSTGVLAAHVMQALKAYGATPSA